MTVGKIESVIDSRLANSAQVTAGTNNRLLMTPALVVEAIETHGGGAPELATQAEAEAGVNNVAFMSPLRVAQRQTATISTQAEAEAGLVNTTFMTPLRVYQAITALSPGGIPFDAQAEVEAGGDLAAALAANDNIYVSGDITIDANISVPDGKTIQWKDGVTVTLDSALGSSAGMTLQGELNLLVYGEIEVVFENTGDFIDGDNGTGTINTKGDIRFSSAASSSQEPFYRCNGSIESVIWECFNGSNEIESYFNGGATIDRLEIKGAGTSTSMTIKNYRVGTLVINGVWDTYTSPATSNFAVWLNGSTCDKVAWQADNSNDYALYMSAGSLVSLFENTNNTSDRLYISMAGGSAVLAFTDDSCRFAPSGTKNIVFGPGRIEHLLPESGATSATFYGVGFRNALSLSNMERFKFLGGYSAGAATFTSTADNLSFVNHEFSQANIFNSGSTGHTFTNCVFLGNETIPSGAFFKFVNCLFSGTVTNASGSKSTFIGCVAASTFTNNDGTDSKIALCVDSSGNQIAANNFISGTVPTWEGLSSTLQTSNNTTTTIAISDFPVMSDGDAYICRAKVMARKSDLTKFGYWEREWYVYHSGGFPLSVNSVVGVAEDWGSGSPAWTMTFGGDTATDKPLIRATGATSETVNWTLVLEWYQVED